MDNLPNELLVLILHFTTSDDLFEIYKSSKFLNVLQIILPIQVSNWSTKNFCLMKKKINYITIYEEHTLPLMSSSIRAIKLPYFYNPINNLKINTINNLKNIVPNLQRLFLGHNFNHNVDNLPESLTHLTLGNSFNHQLNSLPPNLIFLNIGDRFNSSLDNLPKKLCYLIVGHYFNEKINKLPNSITYLRLGDAFNRRITKLPDNLKYLELGTAFGAGINSWPNDLKKIIFYGNFIMTVKLPDSIEYLKTSSLRNIILPLNLLHLEVFDEDISIVPRTLITLKLSNDFNNPIDNYLPNNLQKLTFGNFFNHPVDNLPSGLLKVRFGDKFNQRINKLPLTIIDLTITNHEYNLIDDLPPKLIKFICNSNVKIVIPPILKVLCLNHPKQILDFKIPLSVRYLEIRRQIDIPRHVKYIMYQLRRF